MNIPKTVRIRFLGLTVFVTLLVTSYSVFAFFNKEVTYNPQATESHLLTTTLGTTPEDIIVTTEALLAPLAVADTSVATNAATPATYTYIQAPDTDFNARFVGLLSHIHWLFEHSTTGGTKSITSSGTDRDFLDRQIERTADNISDSISDTRDELTVDISSLDTRLLTAESTLSNLSIAAASSSIMAANLNLNGHWLSGDGDDEGVFVDANGRVGVGTSTPSFDLDLVRNQNARTNINVSNNDVGAAAAAGYTMISSGAIGFLQANSSGSGAAGYLRANALSLYTDNTSSGGIAIAARASSAYFTIHTGGSTERMRVDSTGNVGIGTTTPSSKLSVAGDVYVTGTTTLLGNVVTNLQSNTLTFLGVGAGDSNTVTGIGEEGMNNSAFGNSALFSNTTGRSNTANGKDAMFANTTGSDNTAVGRTALFSNTSGNYNSAFGVSALNANISGAYNTASGRSTLLSNTTGSYNTAYGASALRLNTTGSYNTALGYQSGYDMDTATSTGANTFIGYNTGRGITTGVNNTILGANVTGLSSTLSNNIIIADGAGNQRINVDASGNVGIGTTTPNNLLQVYDLVEFDNADFGTNLGYQAGKNLVSGAQYNTYLGYQAGYSSSTGSTNAADNNTGIGYQTLYSNTTGYNNTANGFAALSFNTTGYNNTANGGISLYSNTTGHHNTANGFNSLFVNTIGSNNTANGYRSLYVNTTGDYNTADGVGSLYSNTTGSNNTALGAQAGRYLTDGTSAASTTDNSLFLGYNTKAFTADDQNTIVIGYDANGLGSNTVVLGNDSIVTTALKGSVGIGTTTPTSRLTVQGLPGQSPLTIASSTGGSMFTVSQSGNVGIGTGILNNFDHYNLNIVDSNNPSIYLTSLNSALGTSSLSNSNLNMQVTGGAPRLIFTDGRINGRRYDIGSLPDAEAGSFSIMDRSIGSRRFTILSSGNVGIGTTTPNNLLQVYDLVEFDNTDFGTNLGYQAGKNLVSGAQYNTFIGYQAGYSSSTGSTNAADNNTAIGYQSLFFNTTGSVNTANGVNSLHSNTSGNANSAFGVSSLYSNTTGFGNTANGRDAFRSNVDGDNNTALGYQAGRYLTNGTSAASTTDNSLFLGYNTKALTADDQNTIVIGYNANGIGSNSVVLGNDSIVTTVLKGNVGIGTTTPSEKLTVVGTIQSTTLLGGSTNLTTDASGNIIRDPSDARLKENVTTIENALDTVLALRGVRYEWIDKERFGDQFEIGFIAQEVDSLVPEVVQKGGEYWSLNSKNLVAVVVEAMKEVWAAVSGHEERLNEYQGLIEELKTENIELKNRLETVERELDIEEVVDAYTPPTEEGNATDNTSPEVPIVSEDPVTEGGVEEVISGEGQESEPIVTSSDSVVVEETVTEPEPEVVAAASVSDVVVGGE